MGRRKNEERKETNVADNTRDEQMEVFEDILRSRLKLVTDYCNRIINICQGVTKNETISTK